MNSIVLFDFSKDQNIDQWIIADDAVISGQSGCHFEMNAAENAVFTGRASLENQSGFSSISYNFATKEVSDFSQVQIRLKGDGNTYQFQLKSQKVDKHSYVHEFNTSGEWETIELSLTNFYPTLGGMKLRRPNYPGELMEQIAFHIGNKKAENFTLELDWIKLK